jgi:hypothetical protein
MYGCNTGGGLASRSPFDQLPQALQHKETKAWGKNGSSFHGLTNTI